MAAVRDWSDGRYTKVGCNLKFILDWAWARVVEIKVRLINLIFIFLLLMMHYQLNLVNMIKS